MTLRGAGRASVHEGEVMGATSTRPAITAARRMLGVTMLGLLAGAAMAQSVDGFAPHGGRGAQVTLRGSGFTGASEVRFNGTPVAFSINGDSEILTTSPTSFGTGPISVGAAQSAFHFIDRLGPALTQGPVSNATLPLGVLASHSGAPNDGSISRSGGQTFNYQNIALSQNTWVYWGAAPGGVRLSLNGNDFNSPSGEVMTYSPGQSAPASGMLVYTGFSALALQAAWPQGAAVCTRLIMQFTSPGGRPIQVVNPADLGLSGTIGALAAIAPGQNFSVNLRFEAAYQSQNCSTWLPALALYDAAPTNPTLSAWSSFSGGFYYENTAPEIGAIADRTVIIGGATGAIDFSLRDAETGDVGVVLVASSDNQALVPDANIVLGGSGQARSIAVATAPGQRGTATITLTATDSAGASRARSFTVSTNDSPTIGPIADVMVQYNQSSGDIPFTIGDAETAAANLLVTAVSSNTTLVPPSNITLGGSGTARTLRLTPFLSQTGSSTITVTVRDEDGDEASRSFVFRVNAPPVLNRNNPGFVAQGAALTIDNNLLRAIDTESGPSSIHFTLNPDGLGTVPSHGELRLGGVRLGDAARFTQDDIDQGRLTYHNDNGCGLFDLFTFNVDDGEGGITPLPPLPTSFSFNLGVELRNDPPTAIDGSLAVGLGASASGQLPGSDEDCLSDDPLVFSIVPGSGPAKGTISALDAATGAYTYTATMGQGGADSFDFQVSDGTSSATARIHVDIGNQPPLVPDSSVTTRAGMAVNGTVTATDPDRPPQVLTYAIDSDGAKGHATIDAGTGAFVYTPAVGRFGIDHFTVVANDGLATSAPGTVTVSIRPVMQAGTLVTVSESSVHGVPSSVIAVSAATGDQAVVASDPLMTDLRGIAADAGGHIYVADGNNGLLHVDAATGAVRVIDGAPGFRVGVRLDAQGRLLVAEGPAGVSVRDVDGTELARYSGNQIEFASDVAPSSDGALYVSDAGVFAGGSNKIVRIDPATGAQTRVIDTGFDFPVSLVFGPDGRLLIGDGIPDISGVGVLRILDLDTGTLMTMTDGNVRGLSGLDVDAAGGVYAANNNAGNVLRLTIDPFRTDVVSQGGELGKLFGLSAVKRYEVAIDLETPSGLIHDGTPKRAIATTIPAGLESLVQIVYTARTGGATLTCMAMDPACGPVDAGLHDVTATLIGSVDYHGSASGVLQIAKATGTVAWSGLSVVFGSTPAVSAELVDEPGTLCTVTGVVGPNVGQYPVHALCSGTNHEASADALAQVTPQPLMIGLSQLAQTYDGTPRVVGATTAPVPGIAVNVLYAGSAAAPIAAGSYAVTATVSDTNYSGSVSGTLVVAKAVGSVKWGALSFPYSGTSPMVTAAILEEPGSACVVSGSVGPGVGAYLVEATCDGSNHQASGYASVQVTPQATQIELSGLVQTFDGLPKAVTATTAPTLAVALSIRYDGSTAAPSAVGEYAVLATVDDPNYSGSASAVLRIVAAEVVDLSIAFVDPRDHVQLNRAHSYTIVVGNEGNAPAIGASIVDVLPPAFDAGQARWTCFPLGNATCTAQGYGHLTDTVSVPASSGLVYVLTAQLIGDRGDATDTVVNSARVTIAGDAHAGNDSATTSARAVLFRDGLESGGNGAWWPTAGFPSVHLGVLSGTDMLAIDVDTDGLPVLRLTQVACALDGVFAVEALRVGPSVWLRLVGNDGSSSAWGELVGNRAMIALGEGGSVLLLAGTQPDLEMRINGTAPFAIDIPGR